MPEFPKSSLFYHAHRERDKSQFADLLIVQIIPSSKWDHYLTAIVSGKAEELTELDNVLTLSTCVREKDTKRYLVIAKLMSKEGL